MDKCKEEIYVEFSLINFYLYFQVTVKEQQEWKIPPCISNWKNARVSQTADMYMCNDFKIYLFLVSGHNTKIRKYKLKTWI